MGSKQRAYKVYLENTADGGVKEMSVEMDVIIQSTDQQWHGMEKKM